MLFMLTCSYLSHRSIITNFFLSLLDPWKDGQFQHVSRRLSFAICLRSLFGSDLQWHSHTTVDSYHSSWVHTTVPCCTRPGVSAHQLWWKITDVACTSYRKLPAMDCWAVSWFVAWLYTYIILNNICSYLCRIFVLWPSEAMFWEAFQ